MALKTSKDAPLRVCQRCGSEQVVFRRWAEPSEQAVCGNCGYRGPAVNASPEKQKKIGEEFSRKSFAAESKFEGKNLERTVERSVALIALLAMMFLLITALVISFLST